MVAEFSLFAATRHWSVGLHFQKGLSGASEETISAAQDTATTPAVLDAFVLAIIAGGGPPSLSRPSRPPARSRGRAAAGAAIGKAADELRKVAPDAGTYVAESSFFEREWQRAY